MCISRLLLLIHTEPANCELHIVVLFNYCNRISNGDYVNMAFDLLYLT